MSPVTMFDVISPSMKISLTAPKLLEDASNWVTYQERMREYLNGCPGSEKSYGPGKTPKGGVGKCDGGGCWSQRSLDGHLSREGRVHQINHLVEERVGTPKRVDNSLFTYP